MLKNVLLGLSAIWQIVQIGGFLDPFRGWKNGLPQLLAAALFLLAYLSASSLCRRVPKYKLNSWHIIAVFTSLAVWLFMSLNIVLGLLPGDWFSGARMTEWRLLLTLLFYSLFAINLAVLIALLNRLKPGR